MLRPPIGDCREDILLSRRRPFIHLDGQPGSLLAFDKASSQFGQSRHVLERVKSMVCRSKDVTRRTLVGGNA